MKTPQLILASASPRRVELLQQIGVHFVQQAADIDESLHDGESPEDFVLRLSLEKAQAVEQNEKNSLPVLGSDTIVVTEKQILGKPLSAEQATEMLSLLSSKTHRVMTAITLSDKGLNRSRLNISEVSFMPLSAKTIAEYVATKESFGKAGAYAIQGVAAQFITNIQGSYSAIMGLPLYETRVLLQESGIKVLGS